VIDQLTHETLTNNLQSKFRTLAGPNTYIELELIEVSALTVFPHQEQFTIVFRGPREAPLGQGTRLFAHENLGESEVFIVPIRDDEQYIYYEAVFNRLRNAS
jgi:hypothetical protein